MTVAVKTSGSQKCTITTEHDLATVTDAGVYQLALDLNEMLDGTTPDIIEVRQYGKARSSDTERLEEVWTFIGAQGRPLWRSPPVISPHSVKYTIKQTQGAATSPLRSFPWAVYNT